MLDKIFAAIGAATLSLAAFTGGAQAQEDPVKVRIGTLLSEIVGPPLYVADDYGIFAENGLEVEVIKFDNGTQMTQALVGGSLDGALAGAAVVSSIAVRGLGVMVTPTYLEYDTNLIYATDASGITSVEDLRGQQLAFPFGTTAHVLVSSALREAGMTFDDIRAVNMGYQATTAALLSEAVPAVVISGGFVEAVTRKGAKRVTSLRDFYPETAVLGGLVLSNAFVESNPEALPKLAASVIEAQVRLTEEEVRRKVYDDYFSKLETYEAFDYAYNLGRFPTAPEWSAFFADGSVANWAIFTAEILKEVGALDRIGDPEDFLAPDVFNAGAALVNQ
ncbi:ABC transporter substrate-binding protein [Vannielia litorea]|uniref:ABC-type nitrate/sulfonate/bicarbonate transport system, substrate-binding protein n=1 Tax=Vannielia litorea TaxID=1217970 RepID=A0A1N6GUC2_9RHOB|nr:ABC transporter substrate-binding protein [Vannielia litorea]SIO10935.1 ABC-type nitrate/sulfonate/bicarbonate transport system, substrate-binding protein [Vannielia litorea]